ncbi:MAG: FkbM family methyltransferase [Sulfitobacter sp.]
MHPSRYFELNFHIPKLQLLEVFPLTPFLWRYPSCNVFDVGANTGLWSEAFLKTHGERVNKHLMFEPLPGNVKLLEQRTQNILSRLITDPTVVGMAMGDATSDVKINFNKESTTLASIRNTKSDFGSHSIDLNKSVMVPQTTVDVQIAAQGIDHLHLMKIDVEGYELNVLRGAEQALAAGKISNVFFEFGVHQTAHGERFKDFFELFNDLGFKVYKSVRGRNFFGTAPVEKYHRSHEPGTKAVEMILASREGPDPAYRGPNVIGAIDPPSKRMLQRIKIALHSACIKF